MKSKDITIPDLIEIAVNSNDEKLIEEIYDEITQKVISQEKQKIKRIGSK